MSMKPTCVDSADVQCAVDCLAGTCQHPCDDQNHAVAACLDYVQVQCVNTPCTATAQKPDGKQEFARWAESVKTGKKTAGGFDWSTILQVLMTLLMQLLSGLITPPAPVPATKGK